MSSYKVPQNVEAEDKIIGYLTFKQLIYTMIGFAWGFLAFSIFNAIPVVMIIVGVPPAGLFLALGLVQRDGQPFETYLLALLNFTVKTRKRVWQKDPVPTLIKILNTPTSAPIRSLTGSELTGRLEMLGRAMDARGTYNLLPTLGGPISFDPRDRLVETPLLAAESNYLADAPDPLGSDIINKVKLRAYSESAITNNTVGRGE